MCVSECVSECVCVCARTDLDNGRVARVFGDSVNCVVARGAVVDVPQAHELQSCEAWVEGVRS